MRTINLKYSMVTMPLLAQICEILDAEGEVAIINAARPTHGGGFSAFMLGTRMSTFDIERRLEAIEAHPALSIPPL